jgi:hypothetical protein
MWGLSHVSKKTRRFLVTELESEERFVICLPCVLLAKKCWAMEDAHMWTPSSSSSSSKAFYCTKNIEDSPLKRN